MIAVAFLMLAVSPAEAPGAALQPGRWDVTSTVASMQIPGVPGFIERMVRGKSRAEHKLLAAGQGVDALIAPDPKARCRIDGQQVAEGRYEQRLSCPQKRGGPLTIVRIGTYDRSGFRGRATVDGSTAKGALHIVLDQRATRTGS